LDKEEFFLLIPAVIYGQALIDVLKVFHHKKTYWEIIAWGVMLIISIIGLWVELYHKLSHITEDAFKFIAVILQAILYAQLGRIITPEASDINTKSYFLSIRKNFFLVITAIPVTSILVQYVVFDDGHPPYYRAIGVACYLAAAFIDKVWFRSIILALTFLGVLFTIYIPILYK